MTSCVSRMCVTRDSSRITWDARGRTPARRLCMDTRRQTTNIRRLHDVDSNSDIATYLDRAHRALAEAEEALSHLRAAVGDASAAHNAMASAPAVARQAVSMDEAAAALGVSRSTLYRLHSKDPIPRIEIDGVERVPTWWLERFVDEQSAS